MSYHNRNSLRIAVWHNLPSGGGKRALHDQVRGLVARGHRVEAWSPPTADLSYMPLGSYCPEHVVACEAAEPSIRGRWGRLTGRYRQVRSEVEAMEQHGRRCAEEINAGGFDVLLANTCVFLAAPTIGRYVRIPSLLYLQEPRRPLYEASPHPDGPRLVWVASRARPQRERALAWGALDRVVDAKWRLNWLVQDLAYVQSLRLLGLAEVINAESFDTILCNSLFSHESILRSYGLESRVCYLGIDCEAFRPEEVKAPYVVGLGSISRSKRIDYAIRALATIDSPSRPPLVWIGNLAVPADMEEARATAEALGVRLEMKLRVSQAELASLLGRAAVMVYAPTLEPFGFAPLEANACGTMVVGVAEGGLRESIRDGVNGTLVAPGDFESLGRAIARYTTDLHMAREDGLRARRHVVEHWGLEPAIDRLEAHLFAAASASPGASPRASQVTH